MAQAKRATATPPAGLDALSDLIEPVVTEAGFGLYDLQRQGSTLLVQVDGGPDVETLSQISRTISQQLDQWSSQSELSQSELNPNDLLDGQYTLQVSSPGLERKLTQPRHFVAAVGETVSVRFFQPRQVRADQPAVRRIEAQLQAADSTGITLTLATDEALNIPYEAIEKARTVFHWGTDTKSRQNQTSSKKGASK